MPRHLLHLLVLGWWLMCLEEREKGKLHGHNVWHVGLLVLGQVKWRGKRTLVGVKIK